MKLGLAAVVIVASSSLAATEQTKEPSPCKDFSGIVGTAIQGTVTGDGRVTGPQSVAVVGSRLGLIERIRKQTGIGVTADCIEPRSPGFRAQGNVTLTYGDIVITTDDAVVKDGEIQLGANARVRVPQPAR